MELEKYPAGSWSMELGAEEAVELRVDGRWILGEKVERSRGLTVDFEGEGG